MCRGVFIVVSLFAFFLSGPLEADTILIAQGEDTKEIRDVLILSQKPKEIVFYSLTADEVVSKKTLLSPFGLTFTRREASSAREALGKQ